MLTTLPGSGRTERREQLALAIRAQVPIDVIADTIQPYPTFSEMVHFAVDSISE